MRSFEEFRHDYELDPMKALELTEIELEEAQGRIVDYIRENSGNKAIVGLSGGIDSSLIAYLAVEAVGNKKVHGFILPSDSNADLDKDLGLLVAEELDISYDVIPINDIVDAFKKNNPYFEEKIAQGNLKARIRMIELYSLPNLIGGRVIGTDNMSENKIGYFTKYGDGGVDNNPIEQLFKFQVRQLSKRVGVPDEIINRPPTAGLWQGQTDEEEIGVTYDVLDIVLLGTCLDYNPEEITNFTGIEKKTVDYIIEKIKISQHKRELPGFPKVMPYD